MSLLSNLCRSGSGVLWRGSGTMLITRTAAAPNHATYHSSRHAARCTFTIVAQIRQNASAGFFWWSRESELVPFSQLRSQEMHSKPLQYPMSSGELLSLALSLSLDDVLSDTLLRYCLLRSPHYAAPRVSAPLKREREGMCVVQTTTAGLWS